MIMTSQLVKELFKGFTVQRWNDKIRTVELIEIDKHAHKMFIAYVLAKYEEMNGSEVNWIDIIRGGIFELLRRIIISDIKSPIFYRIKLEFPDTFEKLNRWVYTRIEEKIGDIIFKNEFESYLLKPNSLDKFSEKILDAAHIYSSYWEFQKIIKHANPDGYQINYIDRALLASIEEHLDLIGMRKLITRQPVSDFVDLCGQLRFQIRWSQTPRLPRTSVLGHSMFVACMSYFFARDNKACPKRIFNDFFGGLFHDLPEAVTRDIISPVKMSSHEFQELIKNIETELSDREIMPLIDENWRDEIVYFTRDEFSNKVKINDIIESGKHSIEDINNKYNSDTFSPVDGELIRAADHLAAFLEAWSSVNMGIKPEELLNSVISMQSKYSRKRFGLTDLSEIYDGFSSVSAQ